MPKPHKSVTATLEKSLVLLYAHKPKHFDEMVDEWGLADENDWWGEFCTLMEEHMKQWHDEQQKED